MIFRLNKTFCIVYVFFLFYLSACEQKKEKVSIEVKPFQFVMFSNVDSIRLDMEKKNIDLMYDDSYYKQDDGVNYYFFDYEKDSLQYFVELFFLSKQLNGFRVKIESNKMTLDSMCTRVNKTVMPAFRKSVLPSKLLLVDTSNGSFPLTKHIIFVRSKELNERLK